jgi:hypothetical protein
VTGILLPSVLAAAAGLVLRRKSARFGDFRFAWWGIVLVAFGIELALYNPPVDSMPLAVTFGPWVWVASRIALLGAVARNVRLRGSWSIPCLVLGLGIALNTVVIVANDGYMPQSVSAATSVWGVRAAGQEVEPGRLQNTRPMDSDSRLSWLGDVLPQPTWLPRPNVLSIGDVLLAVGMAGWIFSNLRGVEPTSQCGDPSSVADVEFGEDVFHMRLNRLDRNKQVVGNRAI